LLAVALILVLRSHPAAIDPAGTSVVQNTFASQTIFTARWAPDGKTIVYSAASHGELAPTLISGRWGAANARLYVVRPDYPEPEPFGPDSAHLLAVSSTGELALLTHPRYMNHRLFTGTLARMPLGGGAPREIMEHVQEADWSPDASQLALTRSAGPVDQLEYPVGKVLYRSRSGGYLSDLRVSPAGDRVAFVDHPIRYDDRGSVVEVDTAGKATTIAADLWGVEGLAWARDGRSVLFSGADRGGMYQLHRAGIGSDSRLVLPSPGTLTLQDVARDGRWLVTRDDQPARILVRAPGSAGVRDLSWLDSAILPIISADGRLLAFTDQSIQAGLLYSVMIRKTDGSPVVRLGDGEALSISRDKLWILGFLPTAPPQAMLYPTGAGEPRRLSWARLEAVGTVDFFPDSRALLVCGNEHGRPPRCYRSPLDGSSLEPVTPDSVTRGLLRPDGQALAVGRSDGWWIYPLGGGTRRRVPGLDSGVVARWSPDGAALWVQSATGPNPRFDRVDVATGRRTPLLTLETPSDVPLFAIFSISLADDPRVYAYSAWSYNSQLFTVQGVR
jgi:dipeptidyl aminopeptidase/acylaminoacyl peptidase